MVSMHFFHRTLRDATYYEQRTYEFSLISYNFLKVYTFKSLQYVFYH